MNETGIVVVHKSPVESIYQLADNGLYLPPHVTPLPQNWIVNPIVKYSDFLKSTPVFSPPIHKKPFIVSGVVAKEPRSLDDLVPNLNEPFLISPHTIPCRCDLSRKIDRRSILAAIVHLNDEHRWPREKIANWLDTLDIDLTVRKVT